jgi:hypothetical protein
VTEEPDLCTLSVVLKAPLRRPLFLVPIALVLAGCGGSTTTAAEVTPKVLGERLDVAKSDLRSAGLSEKDIEVVGGGTFGVVDESKWIVCEQRPEPGVAGDGKARLVVDRSCGEPAPGATTTSMAVPLEAAADAAPATPAPPAVMPDIVCMNLQDAQDEIQRHGVFFSRSEDGTGQGRSQLIDSNWIVIAQRPAPGSSVGEGDAVLTAVKYGEPGPC